MTANRPALAPAELAGAFELFMQASNALEHQYASLTAQVESLNADLVRAHARVETLLNALPAAVILVEAGQVSHFNASAKDLIPRLERGDAWRTPTEWRPGPGPNEFHPSSSSADRTVQMQRVDQEDRSVIQIQDITANLKSAEEAQRLDRLAAMGQMSAGIAHQIRTPLATALLYCSHLAAEQISDEDRVTFAERLQKQMIHLEKLASEMLQFIRSKPLRPGLISVDGLVTDACQSIEGAVKAAGVTLRLNLAANDRMVSVEKPAMISALVAILENAIEHSVPNGVVDVSTFADDQRSAIRIADDGSGISEEILATLFEPFATTRPSGTGLGLAIARNTIRAHRGDIQARNMQERGAEFLVTLPSIREL
jgi:two-component system sensor histidine kinase FlrB